MKPLLQEIRHNPLLWLLVFVPVVFVAVTIGLSVPYVALRYFVWA